MQLKNEIRRAGYLILSTLTGTALCLSIAGSALSQVRINSKQTEKKVPELRAVGVLEWTGEPGKPSASRLVPIAVFSGERYQDAGVYMARPEPMAVERDTEYELQEAGTPKGRFDIFSAGNVEGFWYGYGVWKPVIEYHPPKLAVSKVLPQIQSDADADRPHFSNKTSDSSGSSGSSSPQSSSKTTSNSGPPPNPGNGPHISSSSDDPDRPKLRKRQTVESAAANANADASAGGVPDDPDRPKMHRGKPDYVSPEQKLTGTPPSLQQMVALSTVSADEPHSYVYQWANPEDATKMQSALEKIARQELAAKQTTAIAAPVHKAPVHTAKPTKAAPQTGLKVDDFRAFELSYGGGATLVFIGRTLEEGTATKFVTIIAQPDFYGAPRVIFKQVTDAGHLDETPRMKLVDAVDTNGDHRAELIFELHGKTDRQFGIYQVGSARAEQVFLTTSLP
jgi:hypothetical protein